MPNIRIELTGEEQDRLHRLLTYGVEMHEFVIMSRPEMGRENRDIMYDNIRIMNNILRKLSASV